MKDQANKNRNAIEGIRNRLNTGKLTYDQAQKEAAPILAGMNKRAQELAKEHGMKFKPFSFKGLMR